MTIEEAKKLEHFACAECSSGEDGVKRSQNGFASSPTNDLKVIFFFFFFFNFCYYFDNIIAITSAAIIGSIF